MEIRSNNKAKHRSQKLAFGIFRLLSLCIVLILFAILGFIVYKGIGAISWDFITSAPTDGMTGGKCAICISDRGDEWDLYE